MPRGGKTYERTPEHRARMSEAMQGKLVGNSNARKDEIGYAAVHYRAQFDQCEHADETCSPTVEAALRHSAPVENLRGCPRRRVLYSVSEADYFGLCRSHHRRYDRRRAS